MKIYLWLFIFGMAITPLLAQNHFQYTVSTVSKDNSLFAVNAQTGGQNSVHIYHIPTNRLIQIIDLDNLGAVDWLGFSKDRKNIIINSGKRLLVYTIRSKKQLLDLTGNYLLVKSRTELVIISKENLLHLYDLNSGKLVSSYAGVAQKRRILEIGESPNQKYFYAKTDIPIFEKRITSAAKTNSQLCYVWDRDAIKPIKKIKADNFAFQEQQAIALNITPKNTEITYFNLPEFKIEKKFLVSQYADSLQHAVVFNSQSQINARGKYLLIKIGLPKQEQAAVIDLQNQQQVFMLKNRKLPQIYFFRDSILYLKNDKRTPQYISLSTGKDINPQENERFYPLAQVSFWQKQKNEIPYLDLQKPISLQCDSSAMLNYTSEGEYIFAQKYYSVGNLGIFNPKTFPAQLFYLDSLKEGKIQKNFMPTSLYKAPQENAFQEDSTERGSPIYINQVLNFADSLKNNMKIVQKYINLSPEKITWQVHLLDSLGNYYTGMSAENWQKMICEIYLTANGKRLPLDYFEIKEITQDQNQDFSVVLAIDHSGSMGERRVLAMQEAISEYIKNKPKDDEIGIIKYDEAIGIESHLSKDQKSLLKRTIPKGLKGYGGATAIIDALNESVEMLIPTEVSRQKVVILLTDGLENSSIFSKEEVIRKALENDIKVFAVGFGTEVDQSYLRGIAAATGGSFYQIHHISDFYRIFSDIDKKMRNYYQISLKPEAKKIKNDTWANYQIEWKWCDSLQKNQEPLTITPEEINPPRGNYIDFEDTPQVGNLIAMPINFETDKAKIRKESYGYIDKAVNFLLKYPHLKVQINGHTDEQGTEEYNLFLSQKRASEVRRLMIKLGVEARRIRAKGFGESRPIADNDTPTGRAKNRRTEMLILND